MSSLTAITPHSNLYMPLTHSAVWIGLLNVAAQPQTCGFFVPNAQLSIMAGWAEQLSSWPVATQVDQLRSVCLQMIGLVWRQVFNLFSGVAIMLQNNNTQNPLNISVSETPKPTITELALIEVSTAIGSIAESNAQFTSGFAGYLDSLNKNLSEISVFELIDLLNKYRADFNSPKKLPSKKTSRFNVLNEAKQLIAERVTFDQAMKYPNAIIKFAGMEVIA